MNLIGKIVRDIQYSMDISVEKIGEEIGYSREYMFNLIAGRYKDSEKVESLLRDRYWDLFTTDLKLEFIMRELVSVRTEIKNLYKSNLY